MGHATYAAPEALDVASSVAPSRDGDGKLVRDRFDARLKKSNRDPIFGSKETMRSGKRAEKSFSGRSGPSEGGIDHTESTELRDRLQKAKKLILEEIRNYPRPIAGCDQQFNYLLEERDRISGELSRIASVRSDDDQGDLR